MSSIIERNIIVEGVECAGKTTLIDEMRRKVPGWDLKYLGHRNGNQYERYMWEYMVNKGVIFNRSHFSERPTTKRTRDPKGQYKFYIN